MNRPVLCPFRCVRSSDLARRGVVTGVSALLFVGIGANGALGAAGGALEVIILDHETRQPLAARMHLQNARGVGVRQRGEGLVSHADHFVIDGKATLKLPNGQYTFALDAGPEYKPRSGHFEIQDDADDSETIEMHRFADLSKEGWWSGDLLAVRLARHADPLMRAEDLRILPLAVEASVRRSSAAARQPYQAVTSVAQDRLAAVNSVYVEDRQGAIVIHGVPPADGAFPTTRLADTAAAIRFAKEHGCHVDVAFAASWDLPLWLAGGGVDSIQLIDSTGLANDVRPLPPGCRQPDRTFFPAKSDQGRWAERIYYHVLNCGLKIPPSGGSGSGINGNPPGQNRVYVQCVEGLDHEAWWANLRAGEVFVTNGPLLRANVLGLAPGYIFPAETGQALDLEIGLDLATRDRIEYLEIIQDGELAHQVRLDKWAAAGGRLPPVHFEQSGWFLVRAATINPHVYQLASTGPYYVESGNQPRISRTSVQFFLDWLAQLEDRDRRGGAASPDRTQQQQQARAFWMDLLDRATVP